MQCFMPQVLSIQTKKKVPQQSRFYCIFQEIHISLQKYKIHFIMTKKSLLYI